MTKEGNQVRYFCFFVQKADFVVWLIERKRIPKVLSNGYIISWSAALKGECPF